MGARDRLQGERCAEQPPAVWLCLHLPAPLPPPPFPRREGPGARSAAVDSAPGSVPGAGERQVGRTRGHLWGPSSCHSSLREQWPFSPEPFVPTAFQFSSFLRFFQWPFNPLSFLLSLSHKNTEKCYKFTHQTERERERMNSEVE